MKFVFDCIFHKNIVFDDARREVIIFGVRKKKRKRWNVMRTVMMNFSTISNYWRFSLILAQNEHFHFDSIGNRYLFQAIKKTFIRRRDHLNVFICNIAKLYNSKTFFQPSTVYKNRNKLLTYSTFLCSMNMNRNANLIEYCSE